MVHQARQAAGAAVEAKGMAWGASNTSSDGYCIRRQNRGEVRVRRHRELGAPVGEPPRKKPTGSTASTSRHEELPVGPVLSSKSRRLRHRGRRRTIEEQQWRRQGYAAEILFPFWLHRPRPWTLSEWSIYSSVFFLYIMFVLASKILLDSIVFSLSSKMKVTNVVRQAEGRLPLRPSPNDMVRFSF